MSLASLRIAALALALALIAVVASGALALGGSLRQAALVAGGAAAVALTIALAMGRARRETDGVHRTLDEHRRIEQALRASEAKFAGILDIAADAIISIDESHRIVHFNQGASRIFGYTPAEALGRPLSDLLPPRFRDSHAMMIQRFAEAPESARRMGERREIFGQRKSGEEFPAEASISKLDVPGARLFTVLLRDVTDRKQIERDERFLAEAGRVLASSLDYGETLRTVAHMPIPHLADCCLLAVHDGESTTRVASVDPGSEKTSLFRALEQTLAGRPFGEVSWLDATDGDHGVVHAVHDDWLEQEVTDPAQRDLLRRLGVHTLVVLPLTGSERLLGAMCLLATDARRVFGERAFDVARALAMRATFAVENAQLYRMAKRATRARDDVLGVVSHDLRNPLSAIAMCTRVLITTPPPDEEGRRELLDAIYDATEWMNRLIQDLLDVSNIDAGRLRVERRPEPVGPIVEQAISMFANRASERGVRLESSMDADLPLVDADATRVVQVLSNLINNALEFTEAPGTISVRAARSGDTVQLAVVDTGAGIPPEDLPHIFRRYWTARRTSQTAGTGLGLAIADGIVRAHGGRIWAESTVGEGSSFLFTIPVASLRDRDDDVRLELGAAS